MPPPNAALPTVSVTVPPAASTADGTSSPSSSTTSSNALLSVSVARSACALVRSVAAALAVTFTVPGATMSVERPAATPPIDPPTALRKTSRWAVTVPSTTRSPVVAVSVTSVAAPTEVTPPVTWRTGAEKEIEPPTVVAPSTFSAARDV